MPEKMNLKQLQLQIKKLQQDVRELQHLDREWKFLHELKKTIIQPHLRRFD